MLYTLGRPLQAMPRINKLENSTIIIAQLPPHLRHVDQIVPDDVQRMIADGHRSVLLMMADPLPLRRRQNC